MAALRLSASSSEVVETAHLDDVCGARPRAKVGCAQMEFVHSQSLCGLRGGGKGGGLPGSDMMVRSMMTASFSIALLSLHSLRDATAFLGTSAVVSNKHDLGGSSSKPCRWGHRSTQVIMETAMVSDSVVDVKAKVLQLAAVMDRGGMANPGKKM